MSENSGHPNDVNDELELTAEEKEEQRKTFTIQVGNTTVDVRELTDSEVKQQEWEKFNSKFDRKIMVTLRNMKHHSKCMISLQAKLGEYEYGGKGKWDSYVPDSNFTIAKIFEVKKEEGDLTPIRYFIGIRNDVSDTEFEELKHAFLRHKLLS